MTNEELNSHPNSENGNAAKLPVIRRICYVYYVGKKNKITGANIDERPMIFLDEDLSKQYWEKMGKEEYTWWRGQVYGV